MPQGPRTVSPPPPPNPFIRASDRQASSPGRTTNSWRRLDPLLFLRAAKSTAPSWRPSKQQGEHLRHKLRHKRTPKARSTAPHLRSVLEKPRTHCWQVLYAREKLQAFSPLLALSVLPRAPCSFPFCPGTLAAGRALLWAPTASCAHLRHTTHRVTYDYFRPNALKDKEPATQITAHLSTHWNRKGKAIIVKCHFCEKKKRKKKSVRMCLCFYVPKYPGRTYQNTCSWLLGRDLFTVCIHPPVPSEFEPYD